MVESKFGSTRESEKSCVVRNKAWSTIGSKLRSKNGEGGSEPQTSFNLLSLHVKQRKLL